MIKRLPHPPVLSVCAVALFTLLAASDQLLTLRGWSVGYPELNPLAPVIGLNGLMILKYLAILGSVALLFVPRRYARLAQIGLTLLLIEYILLVSKDLVVFFLH